MDDCLWQSDTYLGCHDTLDATNKNIYGYILWNTDNHQLEGFHVFAKDSQVGHRSKMKEVRTQRQSCFLCSRPQPYSGLDVIVKIPGSLHLPS